MKNHLLIKGARMLLLFLLICVAGKMNVVQAQSAWEQTQNYLFYLVYADYQVGEHIMPQRENSQYDAIRRNLLPTREYQGTQVDLWYDQSDPNTWTNGLIGLAKNETEGFQVFFREQEKERSLRIEVSPFVYENDTLKHAVYYEEFFFLTPQPDLNPPDSLAEALVPYYPNQIKQTSIGHNKVFYVELKATKNQTPGEYTSTITAYDGDDLIDTRTAIAKVWNFALPEDHYAEVVMGLHNRNSGYPSTSSLFSLNGIPVDDNGNVAEEYLDEAKRILQGYHSCLLEHGVSTYEIPRWMMEADPKKAELTMADPRRKVFMVPVLYGDLQYPARTDFTLEAKQVLQQYKDIVYDNPFLKDKAFFSPYNEPEDTTDFGNIDQFCSILSNYWPVFHAAVPFYSDYSLTIQAFEGKLDILCPNQDMFDPYQDTINPVSFYEDRLQDFKTRDHTWRYHGGKQNGGLQCFIHAIAPVGTMRRILFWQQYAFDSDGLLYWNCSYLPNNWVKKTLPASGGIQTGNGDGILLYPSTMFGQEDAAKPVVSLRLKQLAEGIDDYDYLRLAQEFLGEDYARNKLQHVYWDVAHNPNNYLCFLLNRQYGVYYPNNCKWMNQARHLIGEALSAANTEHNWSEWQIAVLPDESHDGLEIRTCSHCGIQESRSMSYTSLYRFVGTEDNQWANLNNWANSPETLPSTSESVVIDSDCEINDNTEVYYVVVNDGFNLTINEGATFTSQRITTEGDAQVIIEDGAQLFTMSEGVQATVKKNVTTQGDTNRWYFISTSLASDVVPSESNGLLSSTEDNYDLYWFNQGDNLEWRNYKSDSFSLENGIGYLYANSEEDASLVFTGTTNGSISREFGLDYDANVYLAGWNLVGNPYPCEVYANTSYYTLNDDGSAIEPNPVSSTVAIPACTGIMVKAEAEGESVVFSKTAPETAANKGVLQIALNMSMTESVEISTGTTALIDKVIVSFNQGDELSKFVFSKDNAKLYIPKGNEDYAIACVDKQGEIPLNFEAKENGNYTISVTPESVKMNYLHLVDNITGTDIDLLVTPNYTFQANRTESPSRFRLVFSAD